MSLPQDTFYDWCVSERSRLSKKIDDYRFGRCTVAAESIGGEMVDQTQVELAEAEQRLKELEEIIAKYDQ
jgi:hypothetical protein